MSVSIEPLESRSLMAATPGRFVVSFYGLGGSGGFGNEWLDNIVEKAAKVTNSTLRQYDEDEGGTALKDLFRSLDRNRNRRIDKKEAISAHVRVVGYSYGGVQAINFARYLLRVGQTVKGYLIGAGVPVESVVTLDPVTSPFKKTEGVSNNVYNFANYYQRKGGNTKVDLYTKPGGFKFTTIEVPDPLNIVGQTMTTHARQSRQVRIDTELADQTEVHMVQDFLEGRLQGRNTNHGTIPFFAHDDALAELTK